MDMCGNRIATIGLANGLQLTELMHIQKLLGVLGVSVALLSMTAAASAPERYEASLSSLPYSAATRETLKGRGRAKVVLDGSKLSVTGTFSGLASAATDAHLMLGLGIGVPGPSALPLEITITQAAEGLIIGDVTLEAKQVAALRQGHVYIQINSRAASTGTLWGWILPEQPTVIQHEPVAGHGFLPQLDIPVR